MAGKAQFSLRWMFAATAAAAVGAGEAVAFPESVATFAGLFITGLLPCAFVSGIVYHRGYGQAFWIGALVWWLTALWMLSWRNIQFFDGGRLDFCVWWSMSCVGGLVAVFVRWLTPGEGRHAPPRSGDRV